MNTGLTFMAMLPEHLLLVGIVLLLGMEIVGKGARAALLVAVLMVAAAAGAAFWLCAINFSGAPFPGQFSVNHSSLVAKLVVLLLAVPVLLMSRDDFEGGEFPALMLSSLYGVCLLISADSFLTMFLGLELMSLPVYALVVLAYRRVESAEAALKYLVLGGAASAMFLIFVAGSTGSVVEGGGSSMPVAAARASPSPQTKGTAHDNKRTNDPHR